LGRSGRRILKAIVAGETDPMKLAEVGGPRLAATKNEEIKWRTRVVRIFSR
jgi:hypothetical protein